MPGTTGPRPDHHPQPVHTESVAPALARLLDADDLSRLAGLLGLLADPIRTGVLFALDVDIDLSSPELATVVGCGEDEITSALDLLAAAGLVACSRSGGAQWGRLAPGFPQELLQHCLPQLVELTHRDDLVGGP